MRARFWTVLAAGLLAGIGTAGGATAGPAVVRVSPAASFESQPWTFASTASHHASV